MTAKFLIFISFILFQPYAAYGFEAIQTRVDETCETIFNKLNLQESINPLGQDIDDQHGVMDKNRQSLKLDLNKIHEVGEKLNNLSLDLKQALGIDLTIEQQIDTSFLPTLEEAEAFVFKGEKFNEGNLLLYYTSAFLGNADAIFALGYYYEICGNNKIQALMFYCYAARKNSDQARQRLGEAYFYGQLGLEKNEPLAKKYSPLLGSLSTSFSGNSLTSPSGSFSTSLHSITITPREHSQAPLPTPREAPQTRCCTIL